MNYTHDTIEHLAIVNRIKRLNLSKYNTIANLLFIVSLLFLFVLTPLCMFFKTNTGFILFNTQSAFLIFLISILLKKNIKLFTIIKKYVYIDTIENQVSNGKHQPNSATKDTSDLSEDGSGKSDK